MRPPFSDVLCLRSMSDNGRTSSRATSRDGSREDAQGPAGTRRIVLVVLALALGFFLLPRATQSCGRGTGEIAPDFTANIVANRPQDLPDAPLSLSSLRGKVVVLDFWATWCGPCQAEMPVVNGIAERFRDQGVVVLGINTSDMRGVAEAFVKGRGIGFPIVYDEDNAIAHKFQVANIPTLIVVGKDGKIAAVRLGVTSGSDLERLVKREL